MEAIWKYLINNPTSAVVATIVSAITALIVSGITGIVSLIMSERRIAAEAILSERKTWRDTMRELTVEAAKVIAATETLSAQRETLWARLAVRLNPFDGEDIQILTLLQRGQAGDEIEFVQRVSLLLKYDWERAKFEASLWRWFWNRTPLRARFRLGQRQVRARMKPLWEE